VGAGNRSTAQVERGTIDLVDAEQLEAQAGADDVADRIHRAHFVEMQALDRLLVDAGFDLGEPLEYGGGVLTGALGSAALPIMARICERWRWPCS